MSGHDPDAAAPAEVGERTGGLERLWTPWRMQYIRSGQEGEQGCFLCDLPAEGDDGKNLILARAENAFVILNKFPYNAGHLMVAPFRHVGEMGELTDEELLDVDHLMQRSIQALKEEMQAQGFNLGVNLGRVAGAGIPDHVHWHVVPRWNGDTNFMPVVSETKVLPELLEETYQRLAARMR